MEDLSRMNWCWNTAGWKSRIVTLAAMPRGRPILQVNRLHCAGRLWFYKSPVIEL
jgi:hypothetical protein